MYSSQNQKKPFLSSFLAGVVGEPKGDQESARLLKISVLLSKLKDTLKTQARKEFHLLWHAHSFKTTLSVAFK